MAQYDELVEALIWLLTNRVQNKINYSHGLLGDGQGRVRVAGNEDFVYARPDRFSSRTQQVFNKRVEGQDGDPIIIGELPWEPGLQQVISIDWQTYKEVGWGGDTSGFVYHGRTHIWKDAAPGLDTFPVYRRQLGDLQATASISGTNAVDISSYSIELYGTQKQFPGTIGYPLTNAIPTSTGTARMALLYWDPSSGTTGYIGVATGTAGIDSESTILNRPVSLPGTVPIAFVRLAAGQGGITEFDIFDAREPFRPGIGFGTGPGQFNAGLIPIADPDGHYTGTSVESALDEIGDGSLPLDTFKVAKLWELDGGAVAWQTDNSGNLSGKGSIFTPGSFIITGTGQAFRGEDGAEPSIGISAVSGRVGSIYTVSGEKYHSLGTMRLEANSIMYQITNDEWNVYATGTANIYADTYLGKGFDFFLQAGAAPPSQAQTGVLDKLGHSLDGGHPLNIFPSSRNGDDAEFNNGILADNNTIGTIASGHFWEWSSGDPSSGSGTYNINTSRDSHLFVRVHRTSPGVDAVLKGNVSTITTSTAINFDVCLRWIYPVNTATDEYFGIRVSDVSEGNYYEVFFRNDATGPAMEIGGAYVDGGARTEDGTPIGLGDQPGVEVIWLRWVQQSNNKYRVNFSLDGFSFFNIAAGAYTFINTYSPDTLQLIFGKPDNAAIDNIAYYLDSFRRS